MRQQMARALNSLCAKPCFSCSAKFLHLCLYCPHTRRKCVQPFVCLGQLAQSRPSPQRAQTVRPVSVRRRRRSTVEPVSVVRTRRSTFGLIATDAGAEALAALFVGVPRTRCRRRSTSVNGVFCNGVESDGTTRDDHTYTRAIAEAP